MNAMNKGFGRRVEREIEELNATIKLYVGQMPTSSVSELLGFQDAVMRALYMVKQRLREKFESRLQAAMKLGRR